MKCHYILMNLGKLIVQESLVKTKITKRRVELKRGNNLFLSVLAFIWICLENRTSCAGKLQQEEASEILLSNFESSCYYIRIESVGSDTIR